MTANFASAPIPQIKSEEPIKLDEIKEPSEF